MRRGQRDADAGPHLGDDAVGEREGSAHRRRGEVPALGQQDGELVAAQPCHRVARAHAAAEPVRELLQEAVADMVAQRVVDLLEAVEVEEEEGQGPAEAQGVLEPLAQQAAVGEPGQRVVQGLVAQPLLLRLALGDVADDGDELQTLLELDLRERQLDREAAAVPAAGPALEAAAEPARLVAAERPEAAEVGEQAIEAMASVEKAMMPSKLCWTMLRISVSRRLTSRPWVSASSASPRSTSRRSSSS
jgi:hypothetical protein